ncbi:MAG: hypothetical protein FJ247_13000 [Nitrospira sp.]|nr:hypothetical protein [Nitrospira sp.]
MTNQFCKAIIEDAVSIGIPKPDQENLLDLFEYAMKSISSTLIREAIFDTTDFATAQQREVRGFQLVMNRSSASSRIWKGVFSRGEQNLAVIGSLE